MWHVEGVIMFGSSMTDMPTGQRSYHMETVTLVNYRHSTCTVGGSQETNCNIILTTAEANIPHIYTWSCHQWMGCQLYTSQCDSTRDKHSLNDGTLS